MRPGITICTVAMNRLEHIRQTLPLNIAGNSSGNTRFLLMDYNSSDGLGEFIRESFPAEIATGKLVYYRHEDNLAFDHSHSRNLAMRLADGDIVCNNDADNFTGADFGEFVLQQYSGASVCLTGIENKYTGGAFGRLCLLKSTFLQLTGYDESFEGYGFEDFDIVNRSILSGCKAYTINRPEFLQSIKHPIDQRVGNNNMMKNISEVYLRHVDENSSEILYLFRDNSFTTGTIINRYTLNSQWPGPPVPPEGAVHHQYELEDGWTRGTWRREGDAIALSNGIMIGESSAFRKVAMKNMLMETISFYDQYENRRRMYHNLENRIISPNTRFGEGRVYRNFEPLPYQTENYASAC